MDSQIIEKKFSVNSVRRAAQGSPEYNFMMLTGIVVFIVGLLSAYYLQVIGQLYLSEIVLPIFIPLLWRRKNYLLRTKEVKWIFLLGIFWLIMQVLTDIVRSTPLTDLLRGWALIIVFLSNTLALYLLLFPNPQLILIGFTGYVFGQILQPLLQPDRYIIIDAWKFGFGQPVTELVLILGCIWAGKRLLKNAFWAIPIAVLGLYSIFIDSRSLGAITLLTALMLFLRPTFLNRLFKKRFKLVNFLVISLVIAGLAWGILSLYTISARNGWLGDVTRVNFQLQSENGLKILLIGRADIIPALYAISDSPILGHGSWARDFEYRYYLYDLIRFGYLDSSEFARIDNRVSASDIIPTHSHILQAWVWGGFAGGVFWLGIFVLITRALFTTLKNPNILFALVIFICFLSFWNILFSNFASTMRLQWAYFLVICLYAIIPVDHNPVPVGRNSV